MTPTAAAIFHRADTLWIVFDTDADIDLSALDGEPSHTIRSASLIRTPDADIVRIKFDHPHLSTVNIDGPVWTVQIGDSAIGSTRALDLTRNMIGPNRSSVTVPFDGAHLVHHLTDPEAGDQLIVVTGLCSGARLHQCQGFRRISRARLGAGRGGRAACRRRQSRASARPDHHQPAARLGAVGIAANSAARQRASSGDVRFPALGF